MAELIPAPFQDLVTRLYREPELQDAVFELPRRRWYIPDAAAPDMSVRFHGRHAGNPLGPAAGPHTQMAQNILLSYVSGARILELKTVQVDDRLIIPRPCIDMTNVGYNVEWSQELRVQDSLREYVAGAMLIEMFRHACEYNDGHFAGPDAEVLHDISVGYDLAGIRSDKVCRFLEGMRDASPVIEQLRSAIPRTFSRARELSYPTRLSDSITLSTFHGCPADEIESTCEFLIGTCDFDVIVKMNPPMLGKERLEHLLHDVLGYRQLRVNPKAYASGLSFDEGVQLSERLSRFAKKHGRIAGFKFSNTLEVINHRDFFTADNEIMYLSGQPLHVVTLTLTDVFRQAVGPDVPISFSAGIDQFNFATAVACGFVPITISTDLLRPGGFGRMPVYLQRLAAEMKAVGAASIDEFVLKRFGQGSDAGGRINIDRSAVNKVGMLNTTIAAQAAREEPRYRAEHNCKVPKRIDSHLTTFDCITCDKCLPVCPNAANFKYPTPRVRFDYRNLIVEPSGKLADGDNKHFEIDEDMQIACYADFCNECGNCDTFCPEYGGPYIKKPSFYGDRKSWERAVPRDGFYIEVNGEKQSITGRIKGKVYQLTRHPDEHTFSDGIATIRLSTTNHALQDHELLTRIDHPHEINMGIYHTLRHLMAGILNPRLINQINARSAVSRTPESNNS